MSHTGQDFTPLQAGSSKVGDILQSPGLGSPSGRTSTEFCLDPQRRLSS